MPKKIKDSSANTNNTYTRDDVMLDTEDRQVLLQMGIVWGIKLGAGIFAVISASITLGLAWRLFEAVRG